MIIPIGHEQSTVERLPWVTFAIMGLCILSYVGVSKTLESHDPDRHLSEAVEYYMEHPYLKPPEALHEVLKEQWGEDLTEAIQEALGSQAIDEELEDDEEPGEGMQTDRADSDEHPSQQEELERLTALWQFSQKNHPFVRWGLVPAHFKASSLVTYMFLHAGFWHLFGNLFFLFLSGPFLENKWGRLAYLAVYLGAGVFAAGLFALRYPQMSIPLVGASGAIAGMLGAFLVRFWDTKIRFFYILGFWSTGTFESPAWLMLPLWFLRELISAHLVDSMGVAEDGGVAYWAHVFGFAFGAAAALALRFWKFEERFIEPAREAANVSENLVLDQAADARLEGRAEEALAMLQAEVQRNPSKESAVLAYWDAARDSGRGREAAPAVIRLMRHRLQQGQTESALEQWNELRQHLPDVQLDAALALKLLEVQLHQGKKDEAKLLLDKALKNNDPTSPSGLLVKLAKMSAALESPAAPSLISRALKHRDLPLEAQRELQRLLDALPAPGPLDVPAPGFPAAPAIPAAPASPAAPANPSAPAPAAPHRPARPAAQETASTFDLDFDLPPAPKQPRLIPSLPDPQPERAVVVPPKAASKMDTLNSLDLPLLEFSVDTSTAPPLEDSPVAAPSFQALPLDEAIQPDEPAPKRWAAPAFQEVLEPPASRPAPEEPEAPWIPDLAGLALPPVRSRALLVTSAVPVGLQGKRLAVTADGKGPGVVMLDRVRAVAVAAVQQSGRAPCLVLDLLLEDPNGPAAPLPLVRLLSTRFDPRALVPGSQGALDAFRRLVDTLLAESKALPLPDPQAARGQPFRTFSSLEQYEKEVLQSAAEVRT